MKHGSTISVAIVVVVVVVVAGDTACMSIGLKRMENLRNGPDGGQQTMERCNECIFSKGSPSPEEVGH